MFDKEKIELALEKWKHPTIPEERENALKKYSNLLYDLLCLNQEEWRKAIGGKKKKLKAEIEENIEVFNRYREKDNWTAEIDFSKKDFSGFLLKKVIFQCVNCEGAIFSKAHCEGAEFTKAHCEGANFSEAYCKGAEFTMAHCNEVDFTGTYCEGAVFREAYCVVAVFREARCNATDFTKADCVGSDFTKAHCNDADFTKAHCEGANFKGSSLINVRFDETWLQFADLYKSRLEGSTIHYAYFGNEKNNGFIFNDIHDRTENAIEKINGIKKNLEGTTPNTKNERNKLRLKTVAYSEIIGRMRRICNDGMNSSEGDSKKVHGRFEQARDVYLNLKNIFQTNGYYEQAGEYFIREMEMRRLRLGRKYNPDYNLEHYLEIHSKKHKFLWRERLYFPKSSKNNNTPLIQKSLDDYKKKEELLLDKMKFIFYTFLYHYGRYGEKAHYILFWSSISILFFAALFGLWSYLPIPFGLEGIIPLDLGGEVKGVGDGNFLQSAGNYLYFSIVTFTTLGYGDMQPTGWCKLFAAIESAFGVFSMAFFVVAWARKLKR